MHPSPTLDADKLLKAFAWWQTAVYAVFQVLENGAYLGSKGVLRGGERVGRWYVWSSRVWMVGVVGELGRLGYVASGKKLGADGEGEKEGKVARREEVEGWWREVGINLAWLVSWKSVSLIFVFVSGFGTGLYADDGNSH